VTTPGLGTILGVWAHPDDETYLTAGLMARAVREGDRVACITATRGEEGSWDEDRWPSARMGEIREAELIRSLEILGVREHYWLEYPDGTLADVSDQEGAAKISTIMKGVEPTSVLTFGPDGMTGHPDHKAISRWAARAFRSSAPLGARLYHAVYTPEWVERFARRFAAFNVFMEEGTPPVVPADRLTINFELPEDILDLKLAAIEEHNSQVEGMFRAFGTDVFREGGRAEFFVQAATK
jgi:LmbE family N-acetylglucosaminyl deacetylase